METRRFALIAVLAVVLFFIYQAWEGDQQSGRSARHQSAEAQSTSSVATRNTAQVTAAGPASVQAPMAAPLATGAQNAQSGKPGSSAASTAAVTPSSTPDVTVHTDTMDVRIGLKGAGLRRVVLEKYPVSKQDPSQNLVFLSDRADRSNAPYLVFQAGLAGIKRPLTDADTRYHSAKDEYRLKSGQDVLDVPLEYTDASGYTIHTTYRFHRGSYTIDLIQQVTNKSGQPLQVGPYARWLRNKVQAGTPQKFVHSFFGIGVYEQKNPGGKDYRFKKIDLGDLKDTPFKDQQRGGWLAMLQQYFIAVMIPAHPNSVTYSARPAGPDLYDAQMLGATAQIGPGSSRSFESRLYIGPKLQGKLDAVAPGLELTEDYGLLTPVAKPLFWVLSKFHQFTGNWGVAIILLTLLIRGAFFKLSEAQYRSMAKMRKFGPRIKELRERYADDRERLNKAMMELYKKEGFNPLAGCWPLVLQFPVFIALYWVLIQSVELRQAPFIFWLQDLSSPDPWYVLPVLYGITMWIQQRLSGQTATMEPTQQKLMNVMPIGLAGFFSFFPSGLVLYYVVSNAFTIVQQWVITRRLEKEGLSHR